MIPFFMYPLKLIISPILKFTVFEQLPYSNRWPVLSFTPLLTDYVTAALPAKLG